MEEVMRKSTLVALVVMVIAAVILPACGNKSAAACKAGLVTDVGKINDGTFNQYAYQGLKKAEKDLGIGTKYIETQAQADYGKNIQSLVEAKCEIVVAVGFMMGDAIKEASGKYPDTKFPLWTSRTIRHCPTCVVWSSPKTRLATWLAPWPLQ